MKENISPEEKLLRLIRGKTKEAIPAHPHFKKNKLNVRKIITLAFSISCIYLVISFVYPFMGLKEIGLPPTPKGPALQSGDAGVQKEFIPPESPMPQSGVRGLSQVSHNKDIAFWSKSKDESKPLEYYLEAIRGKQIFVSSSLRETDKPPSTASPDLIKNINLVGIILGNNPQAIIEEKTTQKTYYLNKGQFIGDFQLEDIEEGKIVLKGGGKRLELYL